MSKKGKGAPRPDRQRAKELMLSEERACIKMGLAREYAVDGRVEYDWEKIEELWLVDPETSMASFCRKYGINYAAANKKLRTTPARKKAIHAVSRGGYMFSVVRSLMKSNVSRSMESVEKFEKSVEELMVFSRSAASFARARMMKVGPGGEEMVNVDAKSSDVACYARIARDASETLKNLLTLRVSIEGTGEEIEEVEGITIDEPAGTSQHEAEEDRSEAPDAPPANPPVRPDQAEQG